MQLDYQQTLQRLQELKVMLDSGTGNRSAVSQEFMRLKRGLPRFKEHKEAKGIKK